MFSWCSLFRAEIFIGVRKQNDAEDEEIVKNEDVYNVVKVLATNSSLVSESINYYLDKNKTDISVHDDEIYAYLKTQYADIFVD